MIITVLQQTESGLKSFKFTAKTILMTVISLVLLFTLVFQVGIYFGKSNESIRPSFASTKTHIANTDSDDKSSQKKQLDEQEQIKSLNAKIAYMQAQLSRLDALGARVVEKAELDPEEFNFSQLPPIGGVTEVNTSKLSLANVDSELTALEKLLNSKTPDYITIESMVNNSHSTTDKRISGSPTQRGWVSSFYGWRIDPFHGNKAWHKGVDIAGKENAEVYATAAGIVSFAGQMDGYGNLVEITHEDGYITRYGHNKEILVKKSQVVSKGESIATMGSTGRSTGPHVHYEIRKDGKVKDPKKYIYRK
jgi:murein DD-endopeptidase MepM/ murein hydrolase activator NlpD